jgi:hypothetical protein
MGEDRQEEQQPLDEQQLEHEQQPLDEQQLENEQQPLDEQQPDLAAQEEQQLVEQGEAPVYAELEARPPLPQAPVRRPRSQRGVSDPQLPTRSSRRFSGLDGPLESLPYTGRRI